MAAFKESGAIEYGSDVLLGLQLHGMDRRMQESAAAHTKRVNELLEKALHSPQSDLDVKILKNRNGSRGGIGRLRFDKKYNHFGEIPLGFTPTSADVFGSEDDDEDEEAHFKL